MSENQTSKLICPICPECPYCHSSNHITQAGWNKTGSKRARCEDCRRYFTPDKKPMGYSAGLLCWATLPSYSAELKAQAIQMHLEGLSFRAVGRVLGVNFQSAINWFNQAHDQLPHHVEDTSPTETVEIDELFTYVGKKRSKPL